MPYSAVIAPGKFNVVLPDGIRYQAGQSVVLTDAEYAQLSSADVAAFLTGVTAFVAGTGSYNDSAPDSVTAVVNAAGASVLGGVPGTAWNQVAAAGVQAYARDAQAECQTGTNGGLTGSGGVRAANLVDTTYTLPPDYLSNY